MLQILPTFNFLHITLKIHITVTSAIICLQTKFHSYFKRMFIIYLCTKFPKSNCKDSSVIASEPKAKETLPLPPYLCIPSCEIKHKIHEQSLNISPRHVTLLHFMTILSGVSITPTSQIRMWAMMLLLVEETKKYDIIIAASDIEIITSFVKII